MCVCVCMRARASVCVCMCVCLGARHGPLARLTSVVSGTSSPPNTDATLLIRTVLGPRTIPPTWSSMHTHTHAHTRTHEHTHTQTYTHTHTHAHTHTHTHTRAHTHARTHIHTPHVHIYTLYWSCALSHQSGIQHTITHILGRCTVATNLSSLHSHTLLGPSTVVHTHTHTNTYTQMQYYVCMYVCVCMHVCMWVCIHTYI